MVKIWAFLSSGTPSRINCQVFILSKFNRRLGDFHSPADFSQVLKSTLFALEAQFFFLFVLGEKWEIWISRDFPFFPRLLIFPSIHKLSFSVSFDRHLISSFAATRCQTTEQQIFRINFLLNRTQLFIYFISSRAQFTFIILTFSLIFIRVNGSRCENFVVVLAVFVCARLHRSIVLINQWFIGSTFREVILKLAAESAQNRTHVRWLLNAFSRYEFAFKKLKHETLLIHLVPLLSTD